MNVSYIDYSFIQSQGNIIIENFHKEYDRYHEEYVPFMDARSEAYNPFMDKHAAHYDENLDPCSHPQINSIFDGLKDGKYVLKESNLQ